MNLGDSLKFLRKYYNYNQKKVADILGVGVSAYSQYENNLRQPSYEVIKKLTEFYNVSYDFLFDNQDFKDDLEFKISLNYLDMYKNAIVKSNIIKRKLDICKNDDCSQYEYLIKNLIEEQLKYENAIIMLKKLNFEIDIEKNIFNQYL